MSLESVTVGNCYGGSYKSMRIASLWQLCHVDNGDCELLEKLVDEL